MHVLSITRVKLGVSLILGNAFIWVHSEGELTRISFERDAVSANHSSTVKKRNVRI
jgi:hypothetical protein